MRHDRSNGESTDLGLSMADAMRRGTRPVGAKSSRCSQWPQRELPSRQKTSTRLQSFNLPPRKRAGLTFTTTCCRRFIKRSEEPKRLE